MPIYRTPVFEDASGRAPGVQLRPGQVARAILDSEARSEDRGSFFLVTTMRVGVRAGWRVANPSDLAAPRIAAPKAAEAIVVETTKVAKPQPETVKAAEAPKTVEVVEEPKAVEEAEPEGVEPPQKTKPKRKKKDD